LHALRQRGISLDIDDFGTGYSALSYLRKLPVTAVKLDKSFLAGIATEASARRVIHSVIGLGLALDLEVVAEGVETLEQFEFLGQAGCTTFQGYWYTRPLPAPAMTQWLRDHIPAAWIAPPPAEEPTIRSE